MNTLQVNIMLYCVSIMSV